MSKGQKLSPKQMLFCKEYLKDLNATQAAIAAGYSKKTAKAQGSRLLTHVDVQRYIQANMDKRAKKVDVSAEDVLKSLLHIRDLALESDARRDLSAALKANELIGKHLKLFTDRIEVEGSVSLALEVQAARERLKE